jgi:hypothetical protein
MWIDHVVLGVRDMEAAGRRMEEQFRLGSVAGGRHEAWGTGNRIVPLGGPYLEMLGVADEAAATANPIGRALLARLVGGDHWLCWCVATDALDVTANRLAIPVDEGSRLRPDGVQLRWRSAGFTFALDNPSLPFFIAWEVPPKLHPGRAEAGHRAQPSGIAWVEVGEDPRLAGWLGDAALPVRTVSGEEGLVAVGIATADGEIALRL